MSFFLRGGGGKNKYVTGNFPLVSVYAAVSLKLNALQIAILNLFIINWLADKLEKFDEDNTVNQLFYINANYWAKHFNVARCDFRYNVLSLTRLITCTDGTKIQIMFKNEKRRGIYAGMHLSVIHQLADPVFYNKQCDYWGKPELKCQSGNSPIIKSVKPLLQIENKAKNKDWHLDLVKDVCEMAGEKNIALNGISLFSHLGADGYLKASKIIDRACKHIQAIYDGVFLREPNLFGSLKETILENKRTKEAVKKLKSCAGNIKKIRAFVLRCAYNYLDACGQGMDCAQMLKENWPVKIDEFFMKSFYKTGDHIAYFLLHYFVPETTEMGEAFKIMENCGLSNYMIDDLNGYGKKYIAGYVNSTGANNKKYWQNITELVKEYYKLKNANKTSYSIASYFSFILEEVQKQADYRGELYPDIFLLGSNSVKQAMKIIKDK